VSGVIGRRNTRSERRWAQRCLAPVAVILAACGGGESPTAVGGTSTSTTAPAVTTSSAVATTAQTVTTRAPATTVGPGPACPSSPLPPNAVSVTTATGSFDGDGRPDVLKAYQAAGTWHLRVEASAGGEVDVTVGNVAAGDAVKAVGGFNVDSGVDEVFASVGSGGCATLVGIWKSGGFCQLTRLTVNGQPSTFPVGASVRNRSGLRCVGGTAVQVLETQSSDGAQYTGTIANYDVVGNTLVLANTSPPQVLAAADPGLRPYGAFTCGSLSLS
jgi:hypothetical protein